MGSWRRDLKQLGRLSAVGLLILRPAYKHTPIPR